MKLRTPIVALCLMALAGVAQAADPNLARNLAATCANCHGTNGNALKGAGLDTLSGMDKGKILQKSLITRVATNPQPSCIRFPRAIAMPRWT